jgi:hypothetical protein
MACLWALVGAGLVVAYALPWLLHPPAQGLDVCYGGRLWEVETVVLMALVPQGIAARIEPRWAGPTSAPPGRIKRFHHPVVGSYRGLPRLP